MICDSSTGNEVLLNGMRDRETFINWNSMGNTISRIDDETSGSTIGVEGENSLDGNVKSLNLESLEHEGSHLFSVGFWISRSFSQHDLVFGWINSKLVREAVVPDFLHLSPFKDDTGLNRVFDVEDTSHLLSLITDVFRFRFNTNHLLVGSWVTDNRWELD